MEKLLTKNGKIITGDNGGLMVQSFPSTLAFLPDTQTYVMSKPAEMVSQIDWLIDNKSILNLKFVGHEGDLVEHWDTNPLVPTGSTFTPTGYTEWSFMKWQMGRLTDANITYSTLPGNHDYKNGTRDSTMYNSYFPLSNFTGMSTYRGSYDTNSDNTYHIVNIDGHDLLILSLEFGPRTVILNWANNILQTYSTTPAIIVTHAYLSKDNQLFSHSTSRAPSNGYGLGSGPPTVNDATASSGTTSMWNTLVYPNNNVRIVICGHDGNSSFGAGLLISGHTDGTLIYQIFANYQYELIDANIMFFFSKKIKLWLIYY